MDREVDVRAIILIVAILAIVVISAVFAYMSTKPYDTPEFIEVQHFETVFLIPLEDTSGKQVVLDSEESLRKLQVMQKRIQIPHRWKPTGRMLGTGEWIPTVKAVTVNRSPVTREWTTGDSGTSRVDQGCWFESQDSIGFSLDFNCTAFIAAEDAAKYLYMYPQDALAKVLDEEVRNRVQMIATEIALKYNLDTLRDKKMEIIEAVRADVIPFYKNRGITITTLGMFGGFNYENNAIQESIDAVFIAQQEKNREKALLDAMASKEERLKREGVAEANKVKEIAKGAKEAAITKAEGEAQGIALIDAASKKAAENPLFYKLKLLDVELRRIDRWNGDVPKMLFGGGEGLMPLIQIPQTD